MLSDRIYRFIDLYVRFLGRIGCIPYKWDPAQQLFAHCPISRRRNIKSILSISVWFLFGLVQAIRFALVKDRTRLSEVMAFLLPGGLGYALFCLMAAKLDGAFVLVNSCYIYARHIHRAYFPQFDPNKSKLSYLLEGSLLLIFLGIIFFGIPCIGCVIIILKKRAIFFTSILPDNTPLIVEILIQSYHLFVCTQLYFNLYTFGIAIFGFSIVIMPFNLCEFRLGRKRYFAPDTLRRPPLLFKAYRAVQLLQVNINNVAGNVIFPVQFAAGKIIVFSIYIVVTSGDELVPSAKLLLYGWAILAYVFWSSFLYMAGLVNHNGKKILSSWNYKGKWKSKLEKKVVNKFRKSCPPLSFAYGRIWTIKNTSLLRFTMSVSKVLFRTLLTVGKEK